MNEFGHYPSLKYRAFHDVNSNSNSTTAAPQVVVFLVPHPGVLIAPFRTPYIKVSHHQLLGQVDQKTTYNFVSTAAAWQQNVVPI